MKRENQRYVFDARIHGVQMKMPDEDLSTPELTDRQKQEMESVFMMQRQRMIKRG